jgi:hypothetical protein
LIANLTGDRDRSLSTWRRRKREHVDPLPALVEVDLPVDQRENRPVTTNSDILAGMPPGPALTAEDAAGLGELTSE